jgi:hypothetical protein
MKRRGILTYFNSQHPLRDVVKECAEKSHWYIHSNLTLLDLFGASDRGFGFNLSNINNPLALHDNERFHYHGQL